MWNNTPFCNKLFKICQFLLNIICQMFMLSHDISDYDNPAL